MVFFDLKVSRLDSLVKAYAGKAVADKLLTFLFENGNTTSKLKVLLSIGHVYDRDFIYGFITEIEERGLNHLSSRIGWDVGLNDPIDMIVDMWRKIESVYNIWQGDGASNCLSPFHSTHRLLEAISERNRRRGQSGPYVRRVYHWTIDFFFSIRSSLREGVDAIITNYPDRIQRILKEPAFAKKFRLADNDDDPWESSSDSINDNEFTTSDKTWMRARIVSGVSDLVIYLWRRLTAFYHKMV